MDFFLFSNICKKKQMDILLNTIIDEYTFKRIKDFSYDEFWNNMNYNDFIEWNKQCINEMYTDDLECIMHLCKLIKNVYIHLVDEESCYEIKASSIYFNKNKKLCIVNPR